MAKGPVADWLSRHPATQAGFRRVIWVGATWAALGVVASCVSALYSFGASVSAILIIGLTNLYIAFCLFSLANVLRRYEITDTFLLRHFFVLMLIPLAMIIIEVFLYEELFQKIMTLVATVPLWLLLTKHLSDRGNALFGTSNDA